jgi:hypothetical protein
LYQLEKAVWTDDDFDRMGWHDARVWALAFLAETYEFVLDLDYIVEWVAPPPGEEYYEFWVVPATLVFENVTGLEIELEPFSDVSLDTITRSESGVPLNAKFIGKGTDWLYDLDFHVGGIRLRSAGYKQYLRGPAVRSRTQYLPLAERGGLSFARSTDRPAAG